MEKISNKWIDYWEKQSIFRDINWEKYMEIFLRSTDNLLNYNGQDIILDIGCGPGYLEAFLKDKVKEVHGVDVSEHYLDICRKKFSPDRNLFFYKLDKVDYTNLSFIYDKKFSLIICLSVIQYYKNINEVEKLIKEVQRVAMPGARFLIADILNDTGMIPDILAALRAGISERHLQETLKVMFRARFSEYSKTRSSSGVLSLSIDELRKLIDKLKLNAEVINTRLTFQGNRKHLLIRF